MDTTIRLRYFLPERELWDREVEQYNALLKLLNPSHKEVTSAQIALCAQESTIIECRHDLDLVGMARLTVVPYFGGLYGRIEDVIVHPDFRGQGIGKQMLEQLRAHSIRMGLTRLELTSNSRRKEAIKLYESLGFEKVETNVFVLPL
jgi:ribosomal protein S18 acetylase RimI-like enzyme